MRHDKRYTMRAGRHRRLAGLSTAALLAAGLLHSSATWGDQIPMSNVPLALSQPIVPNVFFTVDDSGSMDFELLTNQHWEACAYDQDAPDRNGSNACGVLRTGGLFEGYTGSSYTDFHYAFDNADDVYTGRTAVAPNEPDVSNADWRILSTEFNRLYFDPERTYEPWPGQSDQDFTAARSDPRSGKDGYDDQRDLTGFTFAVWEDGAGFSGGRPHRGGGASPDLVGVNNDTASSGGKSAYVKAGAEAVLATEDLDASGASSVTLSVWIREGDDAYSETPDESGNEDLLVEYRAASGDWDRLERVDADDSVDGKVYDRTGGNAYELPQTAAHDELRIRFRHAGGSGNDYDWWHIDDVDIQADGTSLLTDDFETDNLNGAPWASDTTEINYTAGDNGRVDLWDDHKLVTVNGTSITVEDITYSPTTSTLGRTVENTSTYTDPSNSPLFDESLSELKQNIANWYSFERRRQFVLKAAVGAVLDENPTFRYGLSVFNEWDELFVEVPSATTGDFSSHNDDLFAALKDFDFPSAGTPLRSAVERTGQYYDREQQVVGEDEPIAEECQNNYNILMTDGYYNSGGSGIGSDVDQDGSSDTVADTARHYWGGFDASDPDDPSSPNDLAPGLADDVPTSPANPAYWQHMVTFSVAFGVEGVLRDTDGDGWPDPDLDVNDDWGDPVACDTRNCPEKIDDLWHAAFNSKGTFTAAQSPNQLSESISNALETVAERTSSSSAVAVNSGSAQANSLFFNTKFNALNWTGDVEAIRFFEETTLNGSVVLEVEDDPEWRATNKIEDEGPSDRELITYNPTTETGIPFQWTALDSTQQEWLNTNPDSNSLDGRGDERLAYLRGDDSAEGDASGDFRERTTILGDFVNSDPTFVGVPAFVSFPDQWPIPPSEASAPESVAYSDFQATWDDRRALVYAGANDGQLHAFDANTGEEVFSYVPSPVFEDLNELTSQSYSHRFYVDGTPTYSDAYFDGTNEWRSVIVGGLGKGGQGIYALDVTNPADLEEGNASDVVLWEFTDEEELADAQGDTGDADLGLTLSKPNVVRLPNGDWAAVFGNGYNNTAPHDDTPSGVGESDTGNAVLYIVDIETGEIIRKLDTGVGTADDPDGNGRPNGLSDVTTVDADRDEVTEFAYAGDLFGNLWKFDLSSGDASDWEIVDTSGGGGGGKAPLFQTEAPDGTYQPITVRPGVTEHPDKNDGRLVYFGTGKHLGSPDHTQTDQTTQSFYGVWDRLDNNGKQTVFTRDDLLTQIIEDEPEVEDNTLRISTDKSITWFDGTNGKGGWVLDFIDPDTLSDETDPATASDNRGERIVNDPVIRDKRVIFTTLIPSEDPCAFGGKSFLMELSKNNGGRLQEPPFDLNEDGVFNDTDEAEDSETDADTTDGTAVPTGILNEEAGIASRPVPVVLSEGEGKLISRSSGDVDAVQNNPPERRKGRQSWEELK